MVLKKCGLSALFLPLLQISQLAISTSAKVGSVLALSLARISTALAVFKAEADFASE